VSGAEPRRVRLVDAEGLAVFNGLLDDGTEVLRFASGLGFICRREIEPGQRLVDGWLTREEMDAERDQPGWRL
jgi:hypothetical protein